MEKLKIFFIFLIPYVCGFQDDVIYSYECRNNVCRKMEINSTSLSTAISLQVCRLLCSDTIGTVWPRPTNIECMDTYLVRLDEKNIEFRNTILNKQASEVWTVNQGRFTQILNNKIPHENILKSGGYPLKISIHLKNELNEFEDMPKLTLETEESYHLNVSVLHNVIWSNITAKTIYGARHGLETLGQIIVYDDIRQELQILANVSLYDKPAFKWRGLLLDTSRNFYSLKAIKRTLDGMAMVKLNTFHWHITDSQSFPMEVSSHPDLHKLGAYSKNKVYTHADITEVVKYAQMRGIRVLPEFDAPAHVGEGWQQKNMTVCFNAQPWNQFCVEPPCGQLDPTNDDVYSVLYNIYKDMFDLFDPDMFHMGGDEVSFKCWNSSDTIRKWMSKNNWQLNKAGYMRLWDYFQQKALNQVQAITGTKKIPIILWTSSLTEKAFLNTYLDNKLYTLQIWSHSMNSDIEYILKSGFRVIISNHDALYFDCGAANWVDSGNNWCSPYIGWQKVYDNKMENIAKNYTEQVLGAEATIWSEQIDEHNLDQRLWPRASALAERLWSNPSSSWRQAEPRILMHREYLVENGLAAEALQPEWCLQNQNGCPLHQ